MKKTLIELYVVVVIVMAAATIVEKYQGTQFVSENIYGAWWFSLLWAVLAAVAVFWFLKQRVRRLSVVVLHLSFLVILLGAFLTHVSARRGLIHLRQGETTDSYMTEDMRLHPLPFAIRLDRFDIKYYEGTQAAADYRSDITVISDGTEQQRVVSMNRIATHRGFRLYQAGYDPDQRGTTLAVNSDPWGIPVTYTGYALLFLGLIWMLIDPRGTYRQLLRKSVALVVLGLACGQAAAQPTLPRETADKLGRLHIVYNQRIAPVQTYALDFTKKTYGKRSYEDLTAEQFLSGFLFWPQEWSQQPVIRVKSSALRSTFQLPEYCSVNHFFSLDKGGYILGPYVSQYYEGNNDALHKDVAKLDDLLMLIMELRSEAQLTRMTRHIAEYARAGQFGRVDQLIDELQQQQQRDLPLPSALQQWAERTSNAVPFATLLFMANLTLGILALFLLRPGRRPSYLARVPRLLAVVSLLTLTYVLALRWIITSHVPMSNGYETTLTLAWLVLLLSIVSSRTFPIATSFGLLLSGFFLLVSHINQMDPQIGHLMPVLNSPLLSLHVSIIMMSFALLAMTFVCGLTALVLRFRPSRRKSHPSPLTPHPSPFTPHPSPFTLHPSPLIESLTRLSLLMLYPALTTLGLGIFIGAIWANISWGTYWSWDPKEVWALITFMVYAVPAHKSFVPQSSSGMAYHLYMTLAFLTILMTYFGVNYYLGGMHSYA